MPSPPDPTDADALRVLSDQLEEHGLDVGAALLRDVAGRLEQGVRLVWPGDERWFSGTLQVLNFDVHDAHNPWPGWPGFRADPAPFVRDVTALSRDTSPHIVTIEARPIGRLTLGRDSRTGVSRWVEFLGDAP